MTTTSRQVLLASASASRLTLLRQAGIEPLVQVSHVDEDEITAKQPMLSTGELCVVLAEAKGRAVAESLRDTREHFLIIAADSMLEFDGKSYGKPGTPEEATRRWKMMRGKVGHLHTGHWVLDTATGESRFGLAGADVHFADVSDEEIAAYVATGEPLHVAGAFTHEGRSSAFLTQIVGDGPAVAGLSMTLLRELVHDMGIPWISLWNG